VQLRVRMAWRWGTTRVSAGSKFLVVGLLGIGVNQLLLWVLVEALGIYYLPAAAIASQGSTTFNFALVESWVFHGAGKPGIIKRFVAFDALNSLSLLLRLPLLYVFTSGLHVHYLLSNLLAIGLLTAVRFIVADRVIWRGAARPIVSDPMAVTQGSA
jgi:dolichol-phosphate mannosyltransferase